ncbi:hypothetical protein [Rhodanobacter koreensis]
MEHRGSPPDAKQHLRLASRSGMPGWQDAVRRGAILGGVLAGHLVILMMVLHPSWRRAGYVARRPKDHVLRLTFDRLPEVVRLSSTRITTRVPTKTKPARSAIVLPEVMTTSVTRLANASPSTTSTPITTTPLMAGGLHRSYQPGDFRMALQNAQRTRPDHIPGSITPRIGGIRLQTGSSIMGTVHRLAEVSRCTNEQFRLQNSTHQFTPEMIDQALETAGCGPHLGHAALDATIDALSHPAIFGH